MIRTVLCLLFFTYGAIGLEYGHCGGFSKGWCEDGDICEAYEIEKDVLMYHCVHGFDGGRKRRDAESESRVNKRQIEYCHPDTAPCADGLKCCNEGMGIIYVCETECEFGE